MATSILFIDSKVSDYESLLVGSEVEVYVLNAEEDGLLQMAAVLKNRNGLDSIQILSHGSSGALSLGSALLNNANLADYSDALAQIGSSLSDSGDLLLYGCNVAQGDDGLAFINQLSNLTGADVAASDDLTGNSALGGDWDLEATTDMIEADILNATGYQGVLNTFIGTSSAETLNGSARNDVLQGGTGADTLTGGKGTDSFFSVAGDSVLTIGGSGNTGTITGFDVITDFTLANGSAVSEALRVTAAGTSAALATATTGTTGIASTLTFGGLTLKSHAISSAGVITFSTNTTYSSPITLNSINTVAAAVQYLQNNDIGNAGSTVEFTTSSFSNGGYTGVRTYVYSQGDATGTNSLDSLIELQGVTAAGLTTTATTITANYLYLSNNLAPEASFNLTLSFATEQSFSVGTSPRSFAVSDMNGDGKLDIVTGNSGANTVSLLLGNDNGTFQPQTTSTTGSSPQSVALTDVNGDNKKDIVVANYTGNNVSVLLGNGDGTFQAQTTYTTGTNPNRVALADVNGDGKQDIVTANYGTNNVSVLLGNGNGTFQTQTTYQSGTGTAAVALSDVNGDGKQDIVTANATGNNVSVLLGNGNGTFQTQTTYTTGTGTNPSSVLLADLNNDGKQDIVTGNYLTGTISVLLGNGNGTFQTQTSYLAGANVLSVAVADMNNDGKLDLVSSDYNSYSKCVSIYLGNGSGTFPSRVSNNLSYNPYSVALADVNSDGKQDILTLNPAGNSVLTHLNNSFVAPLAYTENASASVINNTIALSDVDSTNLNGATVSISSGFTSGDMLNFSTQNGITGSYNSSTGVLTLSGTTTLANYQTALRSITYNSTSDNPTATSASRTLSWQVNDGGAGNNLSTAVTSTINITAVNDAPTATNVPASLTVTEDVTGNLTLTGINFADVDSSTLTVRLSIPNGTIAGNAGTGITIGGTATARTFTGTAADLNSYFATSGKVTYTTALNDNTAETLTVNVSDGAASNNYTSTINITAVNDMPSGIDATVTTNEDIAYTFSTANFGFSDTDGNSLSNVIISTLPTAGSLTLNGVAVTAGQSVSAANITSGLLQFTPATNANGTGYANFTFKVQDNGSTANGGVDTDSTPNTITVNVNAVNDAPTAANSTFTINEDNSYTFSSANFGYADIDGDVMASVKITSLPLAGSLKLSGIAVTQNQVIPTASIPNLTFTPAANANGTNYAGFNFTVSDGSLNSGSNEPSEQFASSVIGFSSEYSTSPGSWSAAQALGASDTFSYGDIFTAWTPSSANMNNPAGQYITLGFTTPVYATGAVVRETYNNGFVTQIDAVDTNNVYHTVWTGVDNSAPGTPVDFLVNWTKTDYLVKGLKIYVNTTKTTGYEEIDSVKLLAGNDNSIAFNVTAVNDMPSGADKTVSVNEDSYYFFTTTDFGFSDADSNTLSNIIISSLPSTGSLKLYGAPVSVGQSIEAATINSGWLTFNPAANANGTGYANFTFQVQDNGGTANGGVDTDSTPNTITVNVNAVNDMPSGIDATVTTDEDTSYIFTSGDFAFTDVENNGLAYVRISTLPAAGSLKLNGVTVTAGQLVSAANITSGLLKFTPAANANGAGYTNFTFQVIDNGGSDNGGTGIDSTANTITVNVNAVNDAPVIISDGGADTISIGLGENQTEVTNIAVTDTENDTISYALSGDDAAKFAINANGALTFVTAPNFEVPSDANSDNIYDVIVTATDNGIPNLSDAQTIAVTVTDVNENTAPTTNPSTASGNEDNSIKVTLSGTDTDGTVSSFKITSLPANGILYQNAALSLPLALGSTVTATANAANVYFKPTANWNGNTSFQYAAIDNNNAQSVTDATASVTVNPVNDGVLGTLLITGTVIPGNLLTADTNFLIDADGLGTTLHYQWQQSNADGTGIVNVGTDSNTYTLTGSDVGKVIKVIVSYVDGAGNFETTGSLATSVVISSSTGTSDNNYLTGTSGDDVLDGKEGDDTIDAGAGVDRLTGGIGADSMIGGAGNDQYYVDNAGDKTIETGASLTEIDSIFSTISWTLDTNVERLTLTGAAAINATGNNLNNTLTGNGAANILEGGLGNDTLTSGTGSDIFKLGYLLNAATNLDTIKDFAPVYDTLQLDTAIFTALTAGANTIINGTGTGTEGTPGNHLIYNTSTGGLFYDADGSDAGAAVQIALLGKSLVLSSADFIGV